jgi:hypothetical protein
MTTPNNTRCHHLAQQPAQIVTFVVRLRATPGTNGVRALRGLLKISLARFGLRCVSAVQLQERQQ